MRREIGLVGLTFVAVGGVLGSGWLFAPLLASQLAGPAAIVAWGIGAVAMLLLALAFAEITAMFPVAGGIARIPQFSHGRLLAMILGWSAWAGYCTTAPIEVEAALRYASAYVPFLHTGAAGELTLAGNIFACILLFLFTLINAFGVAWFTKVNTTLTWFKLIIPLVFVVVVILSRFEPANYTAHGGFAPYGITGIFAAVASGGVAFAFIGFRHAIDMAGETRDPQRTIPLALVLAVIICLVVYGGIQVAYIGGLSAEELANGWAGIGSTHDVGPLGALAAALGILWLVSMMNVAAVISPVGGALVAVGSNGRLAMAIANNGVFPAIFARLNAFGVPMEALLLNYVVAVVLFLTMPFGEIVALNGAAIVLSFIAAPVVVVSLRALAPDVPRSFRIPMVRVIAGIGFVVATLMIYWSGWDTLWRLLVLIALGLALFAARLAVVGKEDLSPKSALWFFPYIVGLSILSVLGGYGGGMELIPHPLDSILAAVLALAVFVVAVRQRISRAEFDRFMEEQREIEIEEYGGVDLADSAVNRA
ncbi:APC family permease [Acuticoccus kandeliae]|uniref:APC family permease n=1 Tax=Acuticoccus kandeliae TaxID=2073160 RepID=UPI001B3BBB3E|nr:APC family permease [Acuticoccus kandeliae]